MLTLLSTTLRWLNLGIWWSSVVRFTPKSLYPREENLDTDCVGGWVGPRGGLDNMEREISYIYQESNLYYSVLELIV
jgi:hypothetical protein